MRRIAFYLIVLLFAFPLHAQEYDYCAGAGGAAAPSTFCIDATHDKNNTAVVACEDFDNPAANVYCLGTSGDQNCRLTWTNSTACAAEPDFTYTLAPLDGTNSVLFDEGVNGSGCTKAIDATSRSASYLYARLKINALTAVDDAGEQFGIVNMGNRCALYVGWDGTSAVRFGAYNGTSVVWGTSITVTQGTEYHVWLEFVKNTSCEAYVSSTSTKPGSAEATHTAPNFDSASCSIGSYDFAYDIDAIVFDDVVFHTSALGSY